MDFQIWDTAVPEQRAEWIARWNQWPDREVFAHPDYVALYAVPHARALCAAACDSGGYLLYPFLLRDLAAEPFCQPSSRDYRDLITPYGYGGPFQWGANWTPAALSDVWQAFDNWAGASHVVSETVRFSLFPDTLAAWPGDQRVLADNVVRDLRSEADLWKDFEHKVRKNVNKARSSGVTVQVDLTGHHLDGFLAIYAGTMDRRSAGDSYYFPRQYFERMQADLPGQFAYFHAFVGETLVSTELVLVSATRVYSFLGGTNADWFHVRPNDLLKLEIMNWAREAGKTHFVLGGGYTPGDGIYRYKLAFAPGGAVPFSLGSRVLNAAAYEKLIEARQAFATREAAEWQPNPRFFPAYRG